ncbi:MAG: thiamine pyrophosphate-dependent enzyme, partial [Candidatus Gastranaerophilales bacterium]|nr:thiamine pyrophosphate-dependent enzyme [Candidatus Gastranaerophilales bacterium]
YRYNADMRKIWVKQIGSWKEKRVMPAVENAILRPQTVIKHIYEKTKNRDTIIATEVGQHQMWTAQLYKFNKPNRLITSGGLGTMGFGFPAAIGAQIAAPDKLVFNIAGDGSIQMNIQELMTCVDYKIPVKIAVINNGYLGMVRQWQEKLFNKHYSQTPISSPDYVKLAEAYGILGMRITEESRIDEAIDRAIAFDGPVIMDFIVEPYEMVYPWVLAGNPLDEVLLSNKIEDNLRGEQL